MKDFFLPRRIRRDEWMDDPAICPMRHRHALSGLRRLNAVSGVVAAMDRRLRQMMPSTQVGESGRPARLIDIASGSADVPIELTRRAQRRGHRVHLTTVDISGLAFEVQREAADRAGIDLNPLQTDVLDRPPQGRWDVAMCSLFLHHLHEDAVVALLKTMSRIADRVLICDLRRSRFNLTCVNAAARLVTRSDVVHHDADASVRAAFSPPEIRDLTRAALGPSGWTLETVFPCRMILTTTGS